VVSSLPTSDQVIEVLPTDQVVDQVGKIFPTSNCFKINFCPLFIAQSSLHFFLKLKLLSFFNPFWLQIHFPGGFQSANQ